MCQSVIRAVSSVNLKKLMVLRKKTENTVRLKRTKSFSVFLLQQSLAYLPACFVCGQNNQSDAD